MATRTLKLCVIEVDVHVEKKTNFKYRPTCIFYFNFSHNQTAISVFFYPHVTMKKYAMLIHCKNHDDTFFHPVLKFTKC